MSWRSGVWPQAVVFDLDGTLIDSAADMANALNAALSEKHLPPFPLEEVKPMIGGGALRLVERALLGRGVCGADLPAFAASYLRHYEADLTTQTVLYDGARELLERLRSEGRKLGLCSNKPHALTLETLRQLDLARYFSAVTGEQTGQAKKPDPAPLRYVLAALQTPPEDAVMVGDSEADIECARTAGVSAVLVSFGYSTIDVALLQADAVVTDLGSLPGCFARLKNLKELA